MPIARDHKRAAGNRIDKPGDYVVTVENVEITKSKKGDRMLKVTFSTDEGKEIIGNYVQKYPFMMKALKACKVACGLNEEAPMEKMIGKRCGIAVGEGGQMENGMHFMQIEGYGKESEVDGYTEMPSREYPDEVPF